MPTQRPTEEDLDRIEKYLEVDARNPQLLAQAIDTALAVGDVVAARKHANTALDATPGDPFIRHRHANVLMAEGRFDEAAQMYTLLLAQHGDPNIAYNLGVARYRQGQLDEALKAVAPFSEKTPARSVSLALRVLHQQGKVKEAREIATKVMPRFGQDPEFLGVTSLILLDDEDLAKAEELQRQAFDKGGRPIEALLVAGTAALTRRDAQAAVGFFQEALRDGPNEPRLLAGLGMAKLLAADPQAATPLLERATQALPDNADMLEALGWGQLMSQDLAHAEETFKRLQSMPDCGDDAQRGLAVTYALQGRGEDATRSIARLKPDDEAGKMAKAIIEGGPKGAAQLKDLAAKRLRAR